MTSETSFPLRKVMNNSCEGCRTSKVKCVGKPKCEKCTKRGIECVFKERKKRDNSARVKPRMSTERQSPLKKQRTLAWQEHEGLNEIESFCKMSCFPEGFSRGLQQAGITSFADVVKLPGSELVELLSLLSPEQFSAWRLRIQMEISKYSSMVNANRDSPIDTQVRSLLMSSIPSAEPANQDTGVVSMLEKLIGAELKRLSSQIPDASPLNKGIMGENKIAENQTGLGSADGASTIFPPNKKIVSVGEWKYGGRGGLDGGQQSRPALTLSGDVGKSPLGKDCISGQKDTKLSPQSGSGENEEKLQLKELKKCRKILSMAEQLNEILLESVSSREAETENIYSESSELIGVGHRLDLVIDGFQEQPVEEGQPRPLVPKSVKHMRRMVVQRTKGPLQLESLEYLEKQIFRLRNLYTRRLTRDV